MPRCRKKRCCRSIGDARVFKPRGIPLSEADSRTLALDEFEALRLCDHDGLSQIQASDKMEVSRGTVQRLLGTGRRKIITCLLENKALIINNSL